MDWLTWPLAFSIVGLAACFTAARCVRQVCGLLLMLAEEMEQPEEQDTPPALPGGSQEAVHQPRQAHGEALGGLCEAGLRH